MVVPKSMVKKAHRTIKKVTEDIESLSFNTAISSLMMLSNDISHWSGACNGDDLSDVTLRIIVEQFVLLLSPFAPHIAEELWQKLGNSNIAYAPWPVFDPKLIEDAQIEIPVMVNGKVKAKIHVAAETTPAEAEAMAMADEKVAAALCGKTITQKRYVPKKIFTIAFQE